jgi:hypothetical protein
MDQINHYFNYTLRDYLKYPETYALTVTSNQITLFTNQTSKLLEIIKSDPNIKETLVSQLTTTLNRSVYLSTHGNDIVINLI